MGPAPARSRRRDGGFDAESVLGTPDDAVKEVGERRRRAAAPPLGMVRTRNGCAFARDRREGQSATVADFTASAAFGILIDRRNTQGGSSRHTAAPMILLARPAWGLRCEGASPSPRAGNPRWPGSPSDRKPSGPAPLSPDWDGIGRAAWSFPPAAPASQATRREATLPVDHHRPPGDDRGGVLHL